MKDENENENLNLLTFKLKLQSHYYFPIKQSFNKFNTLIAIQQNLNEMKLHKVYGNEDLGDLTVE